MVWSYAARGRAPRGAIYGQAAAGMRFGFSRASRGLFTHAASEPVFHLSSIVPFSGAKRPDHSIGRSSLMLTSFHWFVVDLGEPGVRLGQWFLLVRKIGCQCSLTSPS